MKKRLTVCLASVVAIVSFSTASGAMAATEVGNRCVGNKTAPEMIPIGLANGPGSPLPATVPSAGIVTRYSVSIIPLPPEIIATQALKIFRPTGVAKQFQVVGESSSASLIGGTNTYPTRVPVQAGDQIGNVVSAEGLSMALHCETGNAGDRLGLIEGNPGPGSTATVAAEEGGSQVPIVVFIEPDADKDGFGDETQDLCPQSATTQVACPPITLSASRIVKGGFVTVLITSSAQAPVTVAGTASLGKGKTAKLKGGTQVVAPGAIARFVVPLPRSVKSKLKKLTPKRKLSVKLTATATNAIGQATVTSLKAKLKGQAKPKPKKTKRKVQA